MLPSRTNKTALWREHTKSFTCNHSNIELRERIVKGGGKQYVTQCLRCGEATSSPFKKDVAIENNNGTLPPPFEENIKEKWHNQSQESTQKILNTDNSAFWEAYNNYLASTEWINKRNKVLKRAKEICEGCLENSATQVHHRTYAHVGNEFLFELVAVCDECHDRLHAEPSVTEEENDDSD